MTPEEASAIVRMTDELPWRIKKPDEEETVD